MSIIEHEKWHLRKELSIGTIVSLVVLGVGSVMAYADMKAKVEQKADDKQLLIISERQKQFGKDMDDIKVNQKLILDEVRSLSRDIIKERTVREERDRNARP